jgi:hypothetical protein
MIDIKELRIGSTLSYYGEVGKVRWIHEDGEITLDFTLDEVFEKDLEPVLITEERLIQSGFTKIKNPNNTPNWVYLFDGERFVYQSWETNEFSFLNYKVGCYWQNLENIVFVTTGKYL